LLSSSSETDLLLRNLAFRNSALRNQDLNKNFILNVEGDTEKKKWGFYRF